MQGQRGLPPLCARRTACSQESPGGLAGKIEAVAAAAPGQIGIVQMRHGGKKRIEPGTILRQPAP